MDAAYELIWNYSYGSVTIEAICDRAKVKKGSFYYFFDSKVDLAVAAIQAWFDERRRVMEQLLKPDTPPLERLSIYLNIVVENQMQAYKETGQMLGCPIFTLGSEISSQDGPAAQAGEGDSRDGRAILRGASCAMRRPRANASRGMWR